MTSSFRAVSSVCHQEESLLVLVPVPAPIIIHHLPTGLTDDGRSYTD